MKSLKIYSTMLLTALLLGSAATETHAQEKPKKGWSRKAKGAAVGGGAGVVGGALLGGTKGAIIGGAAGTVAGGAVGRNQDKKKDPARYNQYRNKKK